MYSTFSSSVSEALNVPWAVTADKVDAVVKRLVQVANPVKVILFGSYVRGGIHRDSDLDVLVITDDTVKRPRLESARLRRSVRDISMPMDILVVPKSQMELLRTRRDLIYAEAHDSGTLVYERDPALA